MTDRIPEAVLFDLDGTLADTAPDLIAALARLRRELGLPGADLSALRNVASRGAAAILDDGLPERDAAERKALLPRFIDDYHRRCWDSSRPFEGMPELLDSLERDGIAWGVVTNKLGRLAAEVIERAGWRPRIACLVAGDSTPNPKPAPDPVRSACRILGVAPDTTVFVGDDERDIAAGRAAGTRTAAATWGYISEPGDVPRWGADLVVDSPIALAEALGIEMRRKAS